MDLKKEILVCCCFLLLIASACMNLDDEVEINKERANTIINAIDCYVKEHNQFPTQLEFLVPKYLDELPKTVSGQDFHYIVWGTEYYELGFNLVSKPNRGCGYISRFERWECVPVAIDH